MDNALARLLSGEDESSAGPADGASSDGPDPDAEPEGDDTASPDDPASPDDHRPV
jgi:hypothetical protein